MNLVISQTTMELKKELMSSRFVRATTHWKRFEQDHMAKQDGSSGPWQEANEQHGLRGWTLGEIYGIGSALPRMQTRKNVERETKRMENAVAKGSGSGAAGKKSTAPQHRSAAALSNGSKTHAQAERFKLTPEQAVLIFCEQTTKTAATAALLSTQYGISAKCIRDIWTKRSWANETRPYWPK